ncbi:MAG: ASCH domain-containing protein [Oscillospiraceae bacterium]
MQEKSVLISIQPKWCELIANGKKTFEVRKSRPKLKPPFKCYIYQTKSRNRLIEVMKDGDLNYGEIYHGKPVFIKTTGYESGYKGLFGNKQKIVGEFVCDTIVTDKTFGHDPLFNGAACMSEVEAAAYSSQSPIYGWHISNLLIYDKPKELNEFCKIIGSSEYEPLTRPPQSWCYVYKLDEIWRKDEKNDRARKIN